MAKKTTHDPMTEYAQRVVSGEFLACRLHRLSCERHLRDLSRQCTTSFPYVLDLDEAKRRVEFYRWLRHIDGEYAGKPIELELWQKFVIGSAFGWKHYETGFRRFRTVYEETARKQGKSTKAAGAAISLAFFDSEEGAQVACAATKRDQALIVFETAKTMVRRSPQLAKRIGIYKSHLHVVVRAQSLKPLGADADTLDGLNIHGAIVDEVHAHRTRAMVDVLETATGARRQPMLYYITTAGLDQRTVCWELRTYATKILEGVFEDETWFPLITGIDEGDDWTKEDTWKKANPNYNVSVKEDDLRRKVARALRSPEAKAAFLCKHLNVWTQAAGRAIDLAEWDKSSNRGDHSWRDLREAMRGKKCVLGLDLANTTDIAAAVYYFEEADGSATVVPFFWIPEERLLDRVKRDRVPYDVWLEEGLIIATPGAIIDYRQIQRDINEQATRYRVEELGFDPWNATQLATDLGPDGDGFKTVVVRQGTRNLNESTKAFLDMVVAGTLRHGGHPVLRWMASNLVVRTDAAGNKMPDKERSIEKIDGISALIVALYCAHRTPAPRASIYTVRGARMMSTDGEDQELYAPT